MINVVILQNPMILLISEPGSSNEIHATYTMDGNEVTGIEAEIVSHVRQEVNQEQTTILVIQTEPNVSCMHISYHIYPELPSPKSVCPCETRI